MRIAPLEPQPPGRIAATAALAALAVAAFCLAYTALDGDAEDPLEASWWALVNVAPFVLAFEAGKHRRRWRARAALLGGAVVVSLALDWLLEPGFGWGFEAVRRLPALVAVAGLLATVDRLRPVRKAAPASTLDLRAASWIEGAGNYVVAHGAGPATTHRATLAELEASLAPHGFVRVHRSILVRRDAIARVRDVDVVLHGGKSIRTGARYRVNLAD